MKVAKFGGSSLADSRQCQKVMEIVQADPDIQVVVVSAPGKRDAKDHKVTDMLYLAHQLASIGMSGGEVLKAIADRYQEISQVIAPDFAGPAYFQEIESQILFGAEEDYVVSRGEYLMARLLAAALGWDFLDAKDLFRFDGEGHFDGEASRPLIQAALPAGRKAVVPGFYGATAEGRIVTFPRGGSDISGALLASALAADLYENWTDVSGFLACDPHIVDNPVQIEELTYEELHELAYMGAKVLQEESIAPARRAGIPIQIKNTNRPQDPGTRILPAIARPDRTVTGIAGKKNFSAINVKKKHGSPSAGFFRRLASVFEANQCEIEHMPTSIDTVSVIVADEDFQGKREKILEEIDIFCEPDHIDVSSGLSLLAIVGQGMTQKIGVSERVFSALSQAGINIEMISQGASEMNIIAGVNTASFGPAIRALYAEFFEESAPDSEA